MWKIMRKQVKAFTFCTFSTEFFANFVHKQMRLPQFEHRFPHRFSLCDFVKALCLTKRKDRYAEFAYRSF